MRCCRSDRVNRSSRRSSVAASSHCRSSRKSASGCSGRAKTPIKRRNTSWKRRCASCGGSSGTGGCSPMMSFSSGTRSTISRPFGPSASQKGVAPAAQLDRRSCREEAGRGSEKPERASNREYHACIGRTCPAANSPRGGTSTLCSSLTTEDLPMPEYPETSTSSGGPLLTMRSKEASNVSTSRARP